MSVHASVFGMQHSTNTTKQLVLWCIGGGIGQRNIQDRHVHFASIVATSIRNTRMLRYKYVRVCIWYILQDVMSHYNPRNSDRLLSGLEAESPDSQSRDRRGSKQGGMVLDLQVYQWSGFIKP